MNTYLITLSNSFGARITFTEWLNKQKFALNWISPTQPEIIIVTSLHPTKHIADKIREQYPNQFFIVTKITAAETDGWLERLAWEHIQTPTQVL